MRDPIKKDFGVLANGFDGVRRDKQGNNVTTFRNNQELFPVLAPRQLLETTLHQLDTIPHQQSLLKDRMFLF